MNGSRTIQVIKRDATTEPFRAAKLRLSLWHGLRVRGGRFEQAQWLADAIEAHLRRRPAETVSTGALFEMALSALRATGHPLAAATLEDHRRWRRRARAGLAVVDDAGQRSGWDRRRLANTLCARWDLSAPTGRTITAALEAELLGADEVSADALLDRADALVEQLGLAPWCLLASAPAI